MTPTRCLQALKNACKINMSILLSRAYLLMLYHSSSTWSFETPPLSFAFPFLVLRTIPIYIQMSSLINVACVLV